MKWIKYSDAKPRGNKLILGYYNESREYWILFRNQSEDSDQWPFRTNECGHYYAAPDYWIYIKDIDSPNQ
jgi:hypothetical protein